MRLTYTGAINKPRAVAGIEKKMLSVCFLTGVVIAANEQRLLALVVFVVLCGVAARLTRKDHRFLPIILRVRRQRKLYDPWRRSQFSLEVRGE